MKLEKVLSNKILEKRKYFIITNT